MNVDRDKLIPLTPDKVVEGQIIYLYGVYGWHIMQIADVLNPDDQFKAFTADDGSRYGLDHAYIECEAPFRTFEGIMNATWDVSKRIKPGRTPKDVMCSVMEEVGELAREVRVEYGPSYKSPGVDGVAGEAVDAILCLLDLLYVDNPNIKKDDVMNIVNEKLTSWYYKEISQDED